MKATGNKVLRIVNRIIYFSSAALLVSALLLSTVFSSVQASNLSGGNNNSYQLNLSHIACVNNQVEVHFVLLNVPNGVTPGSTVNFTLKVNNGSQSNQTADRASNTGNVWHYYYYGSVNGKYDVTGGFVWVGNTKVYLHNPDDYNTQNNSCVTTKTPTVTPTTPTASPTTQTPSPTTATVVPTTATVVPTTETVVPTTETVVPTTETPEPTTETVVPTTETVVPTTETPVPTTETVVPTTETAVPTTETVVPTTETVVPTTETPVPTTETVVPTTQTEEPTSQTTPEIPLIPVTGSQSPLVISLDPYCTVSGLMQWTVENPNSTNFTVSYWTLDGATKSGFVAAPGSTKLTTSPLGTHTVSLYYGESQSVSLTQTLKVCPLTIPVTGGMLIPVTGADQTGNLVNGTLYGGLAFGGLGLLLTALRKFLNL